MGGAQLMKPVTGWQRSNVLAAAEYLRGVLSQTPGDAKARVVYEGLLEVLDPSKRTARLQREVSAARAAVPVAERRAAADRRTGTERRKVNLGPPAGMERRKNDRRSGHERRNRS